MRDLCKKYPLLSELANNCDTNPAFHSILLLGCAHFPYQIRLEAYFSFLALRYARTLIWLTASECISRRSRGKHGAQIPNAFNTTKRGDAVREHWSVDVFD